MRPVDLIILLMKTVDNHLKEGFKMLEFKADDIALSTLTAHKCKPYTTATSTKGITGRCMSYSAMDWLLSAWDIWEAQLFVPITRYE